MQMATPLFKLPITQLIRKSSKEFPKKTKALFFEAKNKSSLSSIYSEIDRLEKTEVELNVNALFLDLYQWPLGLAAIFLLIEILLSRTVLLRIP